MVCVFVIERKAILQKDEEKREEITKITDAQVDTIEPSLISKPFKPTVENSFDPLNTGFSLHPDTFMGKKTVFVLMFDQK